ncbi:hypothetical protein ES703_17716 [subsurface metagenome]
MPGIPVRGLPPPQDHGHTGSGDGGLLGEIVGIPELNPMPPAGPEWLGRAVRSRTRGKTEIRVCVPSSQGGYEWIEIGEST